MVHGGRDEWTEDFPVRDALSVWRAPPPSSDSSPPASFCLSPNYVRVFVAGRSVMIFFGVFLLRLNILLLPFETLFSFFFFFFFFFCVKAKLLLLFIFSSKLLLFIFSSKI
jgi:hypothetical protein